MELLHEKYENLKQILSSYGSLAVAFSGGVDSTFLLRCAHDVLKDRAVAITVYLNSMPARESDESEQFCLASGIRHISFRFDELGVPGFKENPSDRCYICKKAVFSEIIRIADQEGLRYVAEGSNSDDRSDYRPGMKAIRELGVTSPLLEAGLSKADIRELSREMGLSTWNKQSFACLSSRFPYGEIITLEKLKAVEKAEELLRSKGFTQYRVRVHGNVARIEVLPEEFELLLKYRQEIYNYCKDCGFDYAAMDLIGYRTGSMNEVL